jgi:hypothetical protein
MTIPKAKDATRMRSKFSSGMAVSSHQGGGLGLSHGVLSGGIMDVCPVVDGRSRVGEYCIISICS